MNINDTVLAFLADVTGPRTAADVAEATGLTKTQASSALSKLVRAGKLFRLADGTGCIIAKSVEEREAEMAEPELPLADEPEVVEAEVVEAEAPVEPEADDDDDLLGEAPAGVEAPVDPMTKTAVYAAMKSIREALRDAERAVERGDTRVAFEGIGLAANRATDLDAASRVAGIKGL